MFIWRTLDKGAFAQLLLAMAERDRPGQSRTSAAAPQAPNADAEIVPLPVLAKPR